MPQVIYVDVCCCGCTTTYSLGLADGRLLLVAVRRDGVETKVIDPARWLANDC